MTVLFFRLKLHSFLPAYSYCLFLPSYLPSPPAVSLLERYPSFVPRFLLAAYKIHVSLVEFGMWKPTVISALRNHKKFIPSTPDLHHCTWNSNCLDQHCADDLRKSTSAPFPCRAKTNSPAHKYKSSVFWLNQKNPLMIFAHLDLNKGKHRAYYSSVLSTLPA